VKVQLKINAIKSEYFKVGFSKAKGEQGVQAGSVNVIAKHHLLCLQEPENK